MIGDIKKFKFWCQKVLPLVYDDSLSYYEVLCKVVQYLNKVIEDVNSIPEYIDAVIDEKLSDEHLQELIEQFVLDIESAISSNNEGDNTNSSADYNVGQMLWWNGKLYRVIRQIDAGDTLIAGTNLEIVNFEDLFNDFVDEVKHDISANDDGGSATATQSWTAGTWLWLNDVLYIVKSDIAQGNAYVFSGANANVEQITVEGELKKEATARATADSTLQTAIEDEADARADAIEDEATARADADTSLQNQIGVLGNLNTVDKSSVVNAINEVLTTVTNNQIYHSPKEYGAVGDGVTDDTVAIQACVDANNLIVFDDGEYLISDTINLHSNMHIVGNGTISNPTEYLTSFECEETENVVIEGISFKNGTKTGEDYTATNANIKFRNSSNFMINNIKDDSHNKMASIFASICHDFIIQNCDITQSGYSGIMLYGSCYDGIICNNKVNVDNYTEYLNTYGIACSCTGDPTGGASKDYECHNILIDSNIVTTSLAYWEGIDTHAGDHIVISNNVVKGFHVGIRLTRYNDYTDSNGGPTYCTVKGNHVIGTVNLHSSRDNIVGIAINGNQSEFNRCNVVDNTISEMTLTVGGVNVGIGVEIGAHTCLVAGNTFTRATDTCVFINNAGIVSVCGNHAVYSSGKFIKVKTIDNEILIDGNSAQNLNNFYDMSEVSNINYVTRSNNAVSNAYWQDNSAVVTDVSKFVPEFVNVNPSASPYHAKGAIAYKTNPTAGEPLGWIANGTTWLAMANLA